MVFEYFVNFFVKYFCKQKVTELTVVFFTKSIDKPRKSMYNCIK